MKILHISPQYYPSIGGNQYHNQLISEKLVQLNEDVHVFTSRTIHMEQFSSADPAADALPLEEVISGVHVRRFKINHGFMSFVLQKKIKVPGAYRGFKMLTGDTWGYWEHGPVVLGMLNAIRELKPDIILASNYYFFTTYLSYLAKKYFKFPLVLVPITHVHDPWTSHPFHKTMADAADLIIACTDFEKRYLIEHGYDKDKISVLPLGIRPEIFQGANGKIVKKEYGFQEGPVIAYFGRKVPHKGIECLIDCMNLVWRQCPDAQLLLAGQAEEYFSPTIQKHIAQYTPEEKKKIINVDNLRDDQKKHFYDAIDIFAMPSDTDCFGIVYLEAWANGKPVIACNNTPQETIIRDGVDGLLVQYGNKEQLAQAIVRLLQDRRLCQSMGEQGKKAVYDKYHLDVYGSALQKEYYRLLKRLEQ